MVADAGGSRFAGLLRVVEFLLAAAPELTVERQMHHAITIESGQEHADQQHGKHQNADGRRHRAAGQPRLQQDLVLAPEPGQREYPDQAQRSDDGEPVGTRHRLAETAHVHHVESASRVVHAARAKEQQGFEERVGEQMEQSGVIRADAEGGHHVAQLADR